MTRSSGFKVGMGIAIAALTGIQQAAAQAPTLSVDPSRLPRLATIGERFQSYNLEMVEVTGGRFWKPYKASASAPPDRGTVNAGNAPAGGNPDLYAYREPIDLSNPRLRTLAAALGPAYVRVSGTWANSTYFAENDETPSTPPNGFRAVLSRERWKGVIDFARAASAEIMTSMATSPGVRDAAGLWQSDQARRLFAYTRSVGGRIAAAEFMNEPNLAAMGGAPKGYDAAAYGRDFKAFVAFIRASEPDAIVLGPGSIGETAELQSSAEFISTRDLLAASGPGIDAFSYHHYGALSQRCSGIPGQTTPEAALSEAWLASTGGRLRSTDRSGTNLRLASRCGLPKPPRQLAAAIPGLRLSSIRSDISISLAGLPKPASKWLRTTRLLQAITACLMRRRCGRGQTIGQRCCGAG